MADKMKIKKGDNVVVITGRDKGKTGAVLRAIPTEARVLVQGINMVKRHTTPRPGEPGGIVEKEAADPCLQRRAYRPGHEEAEPGGL